MSYPSDIRLLESCACELLGRGLELPYIAKVDIFLGTDTLKKGAIVVIKALGNDVLVSGLSSQLPYHVEQASIGQLAWDAQGGLAALVLIGDHDAHFNGALGCHGNSEMAGPAMKRAAKEQVSISRFAIALRLIAISTSQQSR